MRYFFITTSVLVTSALAQGIQDYLDCASAIITSASGSSFSSCTDKSSQDCLCANKDAFSKLSTSTAPTCKGLDFSSLVSTLCSSTSTTSNSKAVPARHASHPMEPAPHKRSFSPESNSDTPSAPHIVYVTETRTDCSCKSTPAIERPGAHISQIPVQVPSSSVGAKMGGATPAANSHGATVGSSSSGVFGSQVAATPVPSGVDAGRFPAFQGAAAAGASVNGAVVVGVAAVMGLAAAL